MNTLPATDGYMMPAEWETHAACWIAWPRRGELHQNRMAQARAAWASVIHAVADFERVNVVVHPDDLAQAKQQLGGDISFFPVAIDDAWTRDSGPTFIKNAQGHLAGVDWLFNAWGRKFAPWDDDDALAGKIIESLGIPRYAAPLVLEGGSIHSNGAGALLTTTQCLLHKNRNPRLNQSDIEQLLADYIGVREFIWLQGDAKDDETDGHVDNIACFAPDNTIIVMTNEADAMLSENRRILQARIDGGAACNLVELPDPAVFDKDGINLIASYVNFYFANGAIVMPKFNVPADDAAAGILRDLFPQRKVVTIDALDIVAFGGGIHCITQQQPA